MPEDFIYISLNIDHFKAKTKNICRGIFEIFNFKMFGLSHDMLYGYSHRACHVFCVNEDQNAKSCHGPLITIHNTFVRYFDVKHDNMLLFKTYK